MMAPRYEYGMGKPQSMGRPPSIADDMARRQQFEDVQYMNALQQQNAARQRLQSEYDKDLAIEREIEAQTRKNRLGLNGLQGMLTDRYSDAYQTVYPSGEMDEAGNPVMKTPAQMGHPAVQMSISPDKNTAPAPLGLSPLRPIPYGEGQRRLKPEYQEAFDAMRPKDSISSNRMTVDEFRTRQEIEAQHRLELEKLKAENQRLLAAQNNVSSAARTAAQIQAQAGGADKTRIASDSMTTATMANPMAPPTFQQDMEGATTRPVSTAANGELQVEVSDDRVIEQSPKGTLVSRGGRAIFISKDGRETDVTDQVAGKVRL